MWLMLDPDSGVLELDGDETVLASAIFEDPDGDGDRITIGVPNDMAEGRYRLIGSIADGLIEVLVSADAPIYVSLADNGDSGDENGNGDNNGDGGDEEPSSPWDVTPIDTDADLGGERAEPGQELDDPADPTRVPGPDHNAGGGDP
jgi:hypothetical protein